MSKGKRREEEEEEAPKKPFKDLEDDEVEITRGDQEDENEDENGEFSDVDGD